MRGKAPLLCHHPTHLRITPAYAGKSSFINIFLIMDRDHPRLCGEKGFELFSQPLYTGSPPPMRGKVSFSQSTFDDFRITPAYAGKSQIRLGLTS